MRAATDADGLIELADAGAKEPGGHAAVATHGARLTRHLRGLGIPYVVPAAVVVELRQSGALTLAEAQECLAAMWVQPGTSRKPRPCASC